MKLIIGIIVTLILTMQSNLLLGQTIAKFKRRLKTDEKELVYLISSYDKYQLADVKVKLKDLDGKKAYLVAKEYKDGELITTKKLVNLNDKGKNRLKMKLTMFCKVDNDTTIKMLCRTRKYNLNFFIPKTTSNEYALKVITNRSQLNVRTEKNKYPIISFILPYEDPDKPGYKFYCAIQGMEIPVEDWGKELGIEHYWIFSIEIE